MPQRPEIRRVIPDKPAAIAIRDRLSALPILSPRDIDARLEALGYRGQRNARRAAAVLAYRHMRRVRAWHLDGEVPLPGTRDACMFLGPTGCGKTFLVELLFREILQVPTLIVDATQFSETGYVGEDVNTILSRLYARADNDLDWASCGIVCMDEFDKLATSRSDTRFAGQQTTKDVSGFGVQRGLLNLLSGQTMDFPADFGFTSRQPPLRMPLHCVTFIACGAFSGLKGVAERIGEDERLGFGRAVRAKTDDAIAEGLEEEELARTTAFARYGFIPELIGRFSRLVAFAPLDAQTLTSILLDSVIAAWRQEFARERLTLEIDDSAVSQIVDRAILRETGARGLRTELVRCLENAAFRYFGSDEARTLRLRASEGGIAIDAD